MPVETSTAPTTHTATKAKFPTKFMIGIIAPDKNCDFQALEYSFLLIALNSPPFSFSALKSFTTLCPEYTSSICAFMSARDFCCILKCFCDLVRKISIIEKPKSVATITVNAIIHCVTNMAITTPIKRMIFENKLATDWFNDCPIVSTSLVILLNVSPYR